jgi:hypothetical protein
MIVEDFNKGIAPMATVNFSVPDDVRNDFNRAFKGQNKSAIIAGLMRRAVSEAKLRQERQAAFRELTARRGQRPAVSVRTVSAARRKGRA